MKGRRFILAGVIATLAASAAVTASPAAAATEAGAAPAIKYKLLPNPKVRDSPYVHYGIGQARPNPRIRYGAEHASPDPRKWGSLVHPNPRVWHGVDKVGPNPRRWGCLGCSGTKYKGRPRARIDPNPRIRWRVAL